MAPFGEALFIRRDRVTLSAWLNARGDSLIRQAVDALPDTAFAKKTDQQLAQEVAAAVAIVPLEVDFDSAQRNVADIVVDQGDPFGLGRHVQTKGLRATKAFLFKGNAELWHLLPSTYGSDLPYGQIYDQRLRVGADMLEHEAERAPEFLRQQVDNIKLYLERQSADIAIFNDRLLAHITPQLQQRRVRLAKAADLLGKL